MKTKTKRELEAEVARLTEENARLRQSGSEIMIGGIMYAAVPIRCDEQKQVVWDWAANALAGMHGEGWQVCPGTYRMVMNASYDLDIPGADKYLVQYSYTDEAGTNLHNLWRLVRIG